MPSGPLAFGLARTKGLSPHPCKHRVRNETRRSRNTKTRVTAGLMNKQVAAELGLSEITVKIHRGNVMKKMGVRSLAVFRRGIRTPFSG
jgi:FixJ family two-component response regulator